MTLKLFDDKNCSFPEHKISGIA